MSERLLLDKLKKKLKIKKLENIWKEAVVGQSMYHTKNN
jgi:hypothetical protein